jgi:hypothetical protein
MLGIFLLIGVAKAFYSTAFDKDRNAILWAIMGIITFYLSQFLLGAIIALTGNIESFSEMELNIYGLIAGVCCTGILYIILQRLPALSDVDDSEFLDANE